MSTFRKKSSSSSSTTGSDSESGSSSSDSSSPAVDDSAANVEKQEKPTTTNVNVTKIAEATTTTTTSSTPTSIKSTRRRSAEFKANAAQQQQQQQLTSTAAGTVGSSDNDKNAVVTTTKPRTSTESLPQRKTRNNSIVSSEDDVTPSTRKAPATTSRTSSNSTIGSRRKNSSSSNTTTTATTTTTPTKVPATSTNKQQQPNKQIEKPTIAKANTTGTIDLSSKITSVFSPTVSDESDNDLLPPNLIPSARIERRAAAAKAQATSTSGPSGSSSKQKQSRTRLSAKRKAATTRASGGSRVKSFEISDSDSISLSEDDDDDDSSYSFTKPVKGKRAPTSAKVPRSDSDEINGETREVTPPPRKLTRSLNTRRSRQQTRNGVGNSDTDTDGLDLDKRSLSKSPAKKPPLIGNSKSKSKKDLNTIFHPHPRYMSPPQLEKKCPVEGCDSSGHLSGNLDKHFLPEACPIFHNMSASECKERANERQRRGEQEASSTTTGLCNSPDFFEDCKSQTSEQRDYLSRIRESRAHFRPNGSHSVTDTKIKIEKDCTTDDDREPSLEGVVPDYDLQLFRDAQALASEEIENEMKDLPVGKGIKYITMGKYKMRVWYQSPYPDDAARLPIMHICEFCLRYQKSEIGIKRHALKCVWRHPPGDEIYRKGKLQVWQVDGKRYKQYCQHLCLLAKFFLDHKTLYYDVEPFLFYIMTLADVHGCHTVGYFSKEKNSFYNVSCILTLPPYQRKGYGRLLIDFSYLLTRVEGKIGSPEKPLSDLGLISYRSYWKDVLLDYLVNRTGNTLSIKDVSQEMAIYSYDIVSTLQALGMMKYWKGKHIVMKKQDVLDEYAERVKRRGNFPKIDEACLRWTPFVPTQTNNTFNRRTA